MKIAIFGAKGRMGKAVCAEVENRGHDVVAIEKNTNLEDIPNVDVAIDFSLPEATEEVCEFCRERHCPLVTGVTGRNPNQQSLVDRLKSQVKVIEKGNFSSGIATMKKVCAELAKLGWDCEIVETHRKSKKDSPSGTAKELATEILKNGNGRIVKIHALRLGSNFGRHEVVFATAGESLTVIHQAENSEIFAKGAVDIAETLAK